jgi:hypothetical protein
VGRLHPSHFEDLPPGRFGCGLARWGRLPACHERSSHARGGPEGLETVGGRGQQTGDTWVLVLSSRLALFCPSRGNSLAWFFKTTCFRYSRWTRRSCLSTRHRSRLIPRCNPTSRPPSSRSRQQPRCQSCSERNRNRSSPPPLHPSSQLPWMSCRMGHHSHWPQPCP